MTMQFLLQCIRSRLALSGHAVTKRPCPLSGPKADIQGTEIPQCAETVSIQNNSGRPQGLAGPSAAG
jgi:hypothetical protein